jgi:Sulfotransferase domain
MAAIDKDFITVVSGLPRSGTSMMMRMLDRGGMPILTDAVRTADDDNPLGYYEFEPVKRLAKDTSWLPGAYNKAVKIIYVFLYNLPREHRYKVLFMKRDLDEVVASQKVMLRRRQEGDRMGDRELIDSYEEQLQRLDRWVRHQTNFTIHYLDYSEVLSQPTKAALDINRFLGLNLDTGAMIQSVDPSLHRNRSTLV